MKTLAAIAIMAFMLLAGCASQSGAQQNQAPSNGSSSGQAAQPSGKGFTFTDSLNLTTTNGTTSTTQAAPPPPPPPKNNTTVTSGSGGQIVDVGGSIPVQPSGSGN